MTNNYKMALAIIISAFTFNVKAQTVSNFENIVLQKDTFYNGKDWKKGFTSGNASFSNNYDTSFGYQSWSGFGISNKKDSISYGYTADGNAITGGGYGASNNYAVAYNTGTIKLNEMAKGKSVKGCYITNNTYGYYTMLLGDMFTRKFGDTTKTKSGLLQGAYPDYLLVRFNAYFNGVKKDTVIDFYLADYRFSEKSKDYIVKSWTWVDFSSLGNLDSLSFKLIGSDTFGGFGLNTPAYFCMDNFTTNDAKSYTNETTLFNDVSLFPNPATDKLFINMPINISIISTKIIDINGREILNVLNAQTIDISNIEAGIYFTLINTNKGKITRKIVIE